MPTITIPPDVTVEFEPEERDPSLPPVTLSFVRDFLVRAVLRDKAWGRSVDSMFVAMEIRTALKADANDPKSAYRAPGDSIDLTADQWTRLCEVVRNPAEGYLPAVMICARAFFAAVLTPTKP